MDDDSGLQRKRRRVEDRTRYLADRRENRGRVSFDIRGVTGETQETLGHGGGEVRSPTRVLQRNGTSSIELVSGCAIQRRWRARPRSRVRIVGGSRDR